MRNIQHHSTSKQLPRPLSKPFVQRLAKRNFRHLWVIPKGCIGRQIQLGALFLDLLVFLSQSA
jgi:hypothetical protein